MSHAAMYYNCSGNIIAGLCTAQSSPLLVAVPEQYELSTACFYITGKHAVYTVTNYIEWMNINLAAHL